MTRPQTRSQTRSGTRNPRNPLAPQLAGIATTRGRGRGRGRARTAHLMNHTPLVIPSPSPLGPAPSSSNDSATGLGDFREFFCDPDDGTITQSKSPTNPPVPGLCPSGRALAARDTKIVSHIELLHTLVAEHHYFSQTNGALQKLVRSWSNKELHRDFGLLDEKAERINARVREAEALSRMYEEEYTAAEESRIIAEEDKKDAITSYRARKQIYRGRIAYHRAAEQDTKWSHEADRQIWQEFMAYHCATTQSKEDALWSHEADRQIWQEFMEYHCASQRPRACTRVGAFLDAVVEWWES